RRERILLTGDLPSPVNPPSGCVFHTRCPKYREQLGESDKERCRSEIPLLENKRPGHQVACHFAEVHTDIGAIVTPDAVSAPPASAYARPPAADSADSAEGTGSPDAE